MLQNKIIVDNPFTPAKIQVENEFVELSSFSLSRGPQVGKAMYCVEKSNDNLTMTFKTRSWFMRFSIGVIVFSLIIILLPILLGRLHWDGIGSMMLCAFFFLITGVILLLKAYDKSVFDLRTKEFQFKESLFGKRYEISLESIIGLQLIESLEPIKSSTGDHIPGKRKFYELNLVLENLERIHVKKMTNRQALSDIANSLAEFLQIPLWWVEIIRK